MAKDKAPFSSKDNTGMQSMIDNIIQQVSKCAMQDNPGTVWSMSVHSS